MKAAQTTLAALVVMSLAVAADARPQHDGHQMPSVPAPTLPNPDCAQAGRNALAMIEVASGRLETARRSNSGADLHDTMAAAQLAVAAAQAELFTCRAAVPTPPLVTPPPAQMAGMDHSKMNMGQPAARAKPDAPGAKPGDAMAGMDHSKMNMGQPVARAKPAAPGAKSADAMAGMDHSRMAIGKPMADGKSAASVATTPTTPPMAGMDHSKMAMGGAAAKPGDTMAAGGEGKLPVRMAERIADPACAGTVGQPTAAKAVFERKVYYFCSTAALEEFRKDPAAYLKNHPR